MSSKVWSNADVLKLIAYYRENGCLWNIKSDLNKRNDIKKKCYIELSHIFNETEDNVKKKIRNLRTSYTTERKKVLDSKKSGSSADDVYKSGLFYYDEFNFLDPCLNCRPSKSNVSNNAKLFHSNIIQWCK